MRYLKVLALVALMLAAVAVVVRLGQPGTQAAAKTPWEYKNVVIVTNDEEELNKLGTQGWELVDVNRNGSMTEYYFKRPR